MGEYVRLCRGLIDYGQLVDEKDVPHLIDQISDWYQSYYYYNDQQRERFEQTGTIKGIEDVYTKKLVFDFDSAEDVAAAQIDAHTLLDRLQEQGIGADSISLFYSGHKGFNVVVPLTSSLFPDEAAALAKKYAGDLPTFDKAIYNASRLLRICGTKHPKSGLYKIPLTKGEISSLSVKEIEARAKEPKVEPLRLPIAPSIQFFDIPDPKPKSEIKPRFDIDLTQKPRHWKNCKWSLLQGNFGRGERGNALMALAATCRSMGFDYNTSYYMCKAALYKSWEKYGKGDFDKKELWEKIIKQIFIDDGWQGGNYSCKTHPWMQDYCQNLGPLGCGEHEDENTVITLDAMQTNFLDYATNFERNTIKTGLADLDQNVTLCTYTLNGLLGQPGAGKTSMAIQYLQHTSLAGIPSMFFSLDMGLPIVYAKLLQKETGLSFKEVMNLFKERPEKAKPIAEKIAIDYKNVGFNFQAGTTIADMKTAMQEQQERTGNALKLVVIDYLECIAGPYADATANTGFIANQLKDLANEFQVCVVLLLQTQKHSTVQISDPLLSLKGVKGSSVIEQSCSTILSLWREGYSPDTVKDDKYISFSVVKNRFGPLWRGDFAWDGVRGSISPLDQTKQFLFKNFQERQRQAQLDRFKTEIQQARQAEQRAADSGWR